MWDGIRGAMVALILTPIAAIAFSVAVMEYVGVWALTWAVWKGCRLLVQVSALAACGYISNIQYQPNTSLSTNVTVIECMCEVGAVVYCRKALSLCNQRCIRLRVPCILTNYVGNSGILRFRHSLLLLTVSRYFRHNGGGCFF